jgi:hypothetical protein
MAVEGGLQRRVDARLAELVDPAAEDEVGR